MTEKLAGETTRNGAFRDTRRGEHTPHEAAWLAVCRTIEAEEKPAGVTETPPWLQNVDGKSDSLMKAVPSPERGLAEEEPARTVPRMNRFPHGIVPTDTATCLECPDGVAQPEIAGWICQACGSVWPIEGNQ